jgi:molybdenum cofactor synthesis domain-containing protein
LVSGSCSKGTYRKLDSQTLASSFSRFLCSKHRAFTDQPPASSFQFLISSMIRVGILTVSDRSARGDRPDASGPALAQAVAQRLPGAVVAVSGIVPDDRATISEMLTQWADGLGIDLILTTGGTGFAPRDVTPEATRDVLDREAPGLAEAMRSESLRVTPHAMLSRAVAGIRGRTLIINLPGSPKAAVENLSTIAPALPHAMELLREEPEAESHHVKRET